MAGATPGASLATIDDILKIDYKDPLVEVLNNKNYLVHKVEQTSEYTSGQEAYIPLHVSRNEGLGARPENGVLPTAGNQGYDKARYNLTSQYARIQLTGQAIARSQDNMGAFIQVLEGELRGLSRDIPREMNRQMFSGKAGILTSIATVGSPANSFTTTDGRFLRENMRVDILDNVASATPTFRAQGVIITGITESNGTYTVTLNTVVSNMAASDWVVREGNYSNEMFGLEDLINADNPVGVGSTNALNTYVGGIDRTANNFWKANEIDHNNANFGDSLFRDMLDLAERKGDGRIDCFITTYEIFNRYGNQLTPDRRFNTAGTMFQKLDGGWDALMYNDTEVMKDRDCPAETIYGLDSSRLMILHNADWDWMSEDGAILNRVPNQDAYEATFFKYCEFAITDPKDCAVAINVATN